MSTDWSEYCISLMQLLFTEFSDFSRAITESVNWVSYEVTRDAFWWMDMDNLNSYEDLMEELNSVLKTFSTSIWVWYDVRDRRLFEQPLYHLSYLDRSNFLADLRLAPFTRTLERANYRGTFYYAPQDRESLLVAYSAMNPVVRAPLWSSQDD